MNRTLFILIASATLASAAIVIDSQSRAPHRPAPETAPSDAIHAAGRVEGATREIELRPQISGRVAEVAVAEGQFVDQGQLLVRLDDDLLKHDVALATAELELAEAKLAEHQQPAHAEQRREAEAQHRSKVAEWELARLLLERVDRLRRERAIPQQEADEQKSKVEMLTAQVEAAAAKRDHLQRPWRPEETRVFAAQVAAARARLELAKAQHARTQLRAPRPAQVLRCNVEPGELADPQSTEPAVILVDTQRLRVRAFVEEFDAPRVKIGMAAKVVADGLPHRTFTGKVARVSPLMTWNRLTTDNPRDRLDAKTREVWIDLDQPAEGLMIGLRVEVELAPAQAVP